MATEEKAAGLRTRTMCSYWLDNAPENEQSARALLGMAEPQETDDERVEAVL